MFLMPLSAEAQDKPADLLAFSLLQPKRQIEMIYTYNPDSDTVEAVGTGDSLRWSPAGRYLAMADTVNDDPTAGKYLGQMSRFSVYDFATGGMQSRDYEYGNFVEWSPDENYLLAEGSVSSGMNGANTWVDFFNPDGSGVETGLHLGFVDGIMGSRGGIFPLGWVVTGDSERLLVRDIGIQRDEYVLLNPATNERTVIDGDLPSYIELTQEGWGEIGVAKSPDNQYAAVTRPARAWNVGDDFSTYLLIVDMNTGETHEVTLPVSAGVVIGQMAWRPCDRAVYHAACYF